MDINTLINQHKYKFDKFELLINKAIIAGKEEEFLLNTDKIIEKINTIFN